jgi:hypothetical protein
LFSARKATVNLLQGEMQLFLAGGDAGRLFTEPGYARSAATGPRLVKVFDETGRSGAMNLDANGRPIDPPDSARAGSTVDLTDASTEDLYLVFEDGAWFVGVLSPPMVVSGEDWSRRQYLFYARRLDQGFLGDISDQSNAEVNVFGDGGSLSASSQEGLLAGGLISGIIDSDAYVKISMLGSNHSLATERTGSYDYQVAYLPVTTWAAGDGDHAHRAAISVPLAVLPESYSTELQQATSIVLRLHNQSIQAEII